MTQRLPVTLTPRTHALRLLFEGIRPVEPRLVSIADAIGAVAAPIAPLQTAYPLFDTAVHDGWAIRARDVAGASSYSPLQLSPKPLWVESGDRLPKDSDCVLDADLAEHAESIFQVFAEVAPGHGIRRAGEHMAAGYSILSSGQKVSSLDVLALHAIGLNHIPIRSPRVCVVDVVSANGDTASSAYILEFAKAAGARVKSVQTKGREATDIASTLEGDAYDLLIIVGGTGCGRTDAAIQMLAMQGDVLAHGLALQSGRSAAVAKIGAIPVVAVPGSPDQALAICLLLIQPVLDFLTARLPRMKVMRPIARKISSSIGIEEIVLLEVLNDTWMPIAVGYLSLDAIARADAWLAVPPDSEGYADGMEVGAYLLREVT